MAEGMMDWRPHATFLGDMAAFHSWAFSAMAELIDNAYDARAEECRIQVLNRENPKQAMLLISDDGHGMSMEELKIMMNLGHCNSGGETRFHKPLGRFGTGFKSGSMHLAKDALIFTKKAGALNVGMMSQTFSHNKPTVCLPITTGDFPDREAREAILSVFTGEDIISVKEVLAKKTTRTAILLKRLNYEFNFDDENDIRLRRPSAGFDYEHSLRDYCSILFREKKMTEKKMSEKKMTMIIGSQPVVPVDIVAELSDEKIIDYTPKNTGVNQHAIHGVKTEITFGLNTGGKLGRQYGVLVYWRNRLIRPFQKEGLGFGSSQHRQMRRRCIGIVDVDNILKPVPNKQDFVKTDPQPTSEGRIDRIKYSAVAQNFRKKLSSYVEYIEKHGSAVSNSDARCEAMLNYEDDSDDSSDDSIFHPPAGTARPPAGLPHPPTPATNPQPDTSPIDLRLVTSPIDLRLGTTATNPQPGPSTPPTDPTKRPASPNVPSGINPKRPRPGEAGDHPGPVTGGRPAPAKNTTFQGKVFRLLSHLVLFLHPDLEPVDPLLELGQEADIEQKVDLLMEEFGLMKPPASERYDIPHPPKPPRNDHVESWNSVTEIFLDTEGPIDDITQVAAIRGGECFDKVNIQPATREHVLQGLCTWLSKSANNVLVGHSIDTRDRPALMLALDACGLTDTFRNHVVGFLDTKLLFRTTYPALGKHTLKGLATHFLGIKRFTQHNARGDADILKKLMAKVPADDESKIEASRSMESAQEIFQELKRYRENFPSLQPMVDDSFISRNAANKIARSGLQLLHLKKVFKKAGKQGIRDVLSQPVPGGVRVTEKETTMTQIENFFLRHP